MTHIKCFSIAFGRDYVDWQISHGNMKDTPGTGLLKKYRSTTLNEFRKGSVPLNANKLGL